MNPRSSASTPATKVRISSRERVVFPESGTTKGDVADYYQAIAQWILPWVANRPLSLVRCPDGGGAECFFQKHHAQRLGDDVHAIPLRQKSGVEDYLYITDAAGLMELVQMNTLEFHPWGSRIDRPENPDMLVFDLDPDPEIDWVAVVAGARHVRRQLRKAGLESFVRLSGGKGLHVVVPLARGVEWDAAKDFCGAFAQGMAERDPGRYVATMSKARRTGRIFIDWLRNGRGSTCVCNWSLRARKGGTIAVPVRWQDLGRIEGPDAYDPARALRRARSLKEDPWADYHALKQTLPA